MPEIAGTPGAAAHFGVVLMAPSTCMLRDAAASTSLSTFDQSYLSDDVGCTPAHGMKMRTTRKPEAVALSSGLAVDIGVGESDDRRSVGNLRRALDGDGVRTADGLDGPDRGEYGGTRGDRDGKCGDGAVAVTTSNCGHFPTPICRSEA